MIQQVHLHSTTQLIKKPQKFHHKRKQSWHKTRKETNNSTRKTERKELYTVLACWMSASSPFNESLNTFGMAFVLFNAKNPPNRRRNHSTSHRKNSSQQFLLRIWTNDAAPNSKFGTFFFRRGKRRRRTPRGGRGEVGVSGESRVGRRFSNMES